MQISEQLLACPCRSECVDPTAERHTLDGGEQESGIVVLEWQMRSCGRTAYKVDQGLVLLCCRRLRCVQTTINYYIFIILMRILEQS